MKKIILSFLLIIYSVSAYATEDKESSYNRIQRTGIIKCGYIIWPPFLDKDVNTGNLSGMNFDYMQALADSLGLKVEWTSEVINGQQVEALRSGKIDVICSAEGPFVPSTSRYLFYSEPLAYFPSVFYARIDDKRFDNNIESINSPEVRIVTIDGDASYEVSKAQFPLAKRHSIPQTSSAGQMMLEVVSKKADLVTTDAMTIAQFLKENPNTLKEVILPNPVAVIPNTFSVLQGKNGIELITLINQGIHNLQHFGTENYIFRKYDKGLKGVYRVAKPYEEKN